MTALLIPVYFKQKIDAILIVLRKLVIKEKGSHYTEEAFWVLSLLKNYKIIS